MLFLQAEELKEKEKENHKLVNDLEEKQTKCSKLVTDFCSISTKDFNFFLAVIIGYSKVLQAVIIVHTILHKCNTSSSLMPMTVFC